MTTTLFLIITMVLAVMQAAPPVPRKASDSPASTGESLQQNAPSDKKKTKTSETLIPSHSVAGDQENGGEKRDDDAQHSIRVTELPSVTVSSPRRDWADWGTWLVNFLLFLTSGLQVWLLCRTLKSVRRQTFEMMKQRGAMQQQLGAMRDQLKTAQDGIAMQIEKEKPIIKLHIHPFNINQNSGLYKQVQYRLECSCPTRTVVESAEFCAFIGGLEPEFPMILLPEEIGILNNSTEIPKTRLIFEQFTDETVNRIKADKLFVHFVGTVRYRGVGAGKEPYKAAVRKRWRNTLSAIPGLNDEKWEAYGTPEQNH